MSARRRFRVETLPEGPTLLDEGPTHHLLHVLRLGVGARVRVFDGHGSEQEVDVVDVQGSDVTILPVGPVVASAPTVPAHLLLASLKPKALDLALRMSVEAGITHIRIFPAARSIRRPARLDRWVRITEAAAQQCGRADLPDLDAMPSLDAAMLRAQDEGCAVHLALPQADRLPPPTSPVAVVVGPEGGFTPAEVRQGLQAGARPLGLGDWVLRADTAALLASAWASSGPP